jgi:protein-L-isoaspartate(D-aspartate) O-methyltransferase
MSTEGPTGAAAAAARRERMVRLQIANRGVTDERVLEAMRSVPRELFVAPGYEEFAYEDRALPIAEGQTISQPYVVALTAEAARLRPTDRVLEVGTGCGYAAAVFSRLAGWVHTIERLRGLVETARRNLGSAGCANVTVHEGDGSLGLADHSPFDAILVAAGGPRLPKAFKDQLTVGGRIVMPLGGDRDAQSLVRLTLSPDGSFVRDDLGPVRFVPLVGREAWPPGGTSAA